MINTSYCPENHEKQRKTNSLIPQTSVLASKIKLTSYMRAFLVVQMVKNLPAMQETWVWSLGWEDPLEKGMTTHSNILAWRIPWTEKPGGLQSMGGKELGTTEWLTHMMLLCEGYFSVLSPIFPYVFLTRKRWALLWIPSWVTFPRGLL